MNRKEFLTVCGGACLGVVGLGSLLQSCGLAQPVPSSLKDTVLQVSKSSFIREKKNGVKYRRSILVQPEEMDYPIVVYRNDESNYTALLLRCTHQGNRLNVSGNILTCPAHGSEFDQHGKVITGPAGENLTRYVVTSDETMIYIQLT